jgi:hypothetical protein
MKKPFYKKMSSQQQSPVSSNVQFSSNPILTKECNIKLPIDKENIPNNISLLNPSSISPDICNKDNIASPHHIHNARVRLAGRTPHNETKKNKNKKDKKFKKECIIYNDNEENIIDNKDNIIQDEIINIENSSTPTNIDIINGNDNHDDVKDINIITAIKQITDENFSISSNSNDNSMEQFGDDLAKSGPKSRPSLSRTSPYIFNETKDNSSNISSLIVNNILEIANFNNNKEEEEDNIELNNSKLLRPIAINKSDNNLKDNVKDININMSFKPVSFSTTSAFALKSPNSIKKNEDFIKNESTEEEVHESHNKDIAIGASHKNPSLPPRIPIMSNFLGNKTNDNNSNNRNKSRGISAPPPLSRNKHINELICPISPKGESVDDIALTPTKLIKTTKENSRHSSPVISILCLPQPQENIFESNPSIINSYCNKIPIEDNFSITISNKSSINKLHDDDLIDAEVSPSSKDSVYIDNNNIPLDKSTNISPCIEENNCHLGIAEMKEKSNQDLPIIGLNSPQHYSAPSDSTFEKQAYNNQSYHNYSNNTSISFNGAIAAYAQGGVSLSLPGLGKGRQLNNSSMLDISSTDYYRHSFTPKISPGSSRNYPMNRSVFDNKSAIVTNLSYSNNDFNQEIPIESKAIMNNNSLHQHIRVAEKPNPVQYTIIKQLPIGIAESSNANKGITSEPALKIEPSFASSSTKAPSLHKKSSKPSASRINLDMPPPMSVSVKNVKAAVADIPVNTKPITTSVRIEDINFDVSIDSTFNDIEVPKYNNNNNNILDVFNNMKQVEDGGEIDLNQTENGLDDLCWNTSSYVPDKVQSVIETDDKVFKVLEFSAESRSTPVTASNNLKISSTLTGNKVGGAVRITKEIADYEAMNQSNSQSYVAFDVSVVNDSRHFDMNETNNKSPNKSSTMDDDFSYNNQIDVENEWNNDKTTDKSNIDDEINNESVYVNNDHDNSAIMTVATTITVDQSCMNSTDTSFDDDTPFKPPKLIVASKEIRKDNMDDDEKDDIKEITLVTEPGSFTTIVLSFGNKKGKSLTMRPKAIQMRFDPFLNDNELINKSNDNNEDTILDDHGKCGLNGSIIGNLNNSNDKNSINVFQVSPRVMEIPSNGERSMYVTFSPGRNDAGIYSGALKIIAGKKTFVLLLRGEARKPITTIENIPNNISINDHNMSKSIDKKVIETKYEDDKIMQPIIDKPYFNDCFDFSRDQGVYNNTAVSKQLNHSIPAHPENKNNQNGDYSFTANISHIDNNEHPLFINDHSIIDNNLEVSNVVGDEIMKMRQQSMRLWLGQEKNKNLSSPQCYTIAWTPQSNIMNNPSFESFADSLLKTNFSKYSPEKGDKDISYYSKLYSHKDYNNNCNSPTIQSPSFHDMSNTFSTINSSRNLSTWHHSNDPYQSISKKKTYHSLIKESKNDNRYLNKNKILDKDQHIIKTSNEVKINSKKSSKKRETGVFFRRNIIHFGSVTVGSLSRLKIELCNTTDKEMTVVIEDPLLPFVLLHNEVKLRAKSYVRVPIRFVPVTNDEYSIQLNATTIEGNFHTSITLTGNSY